MPVSGEDGRHDAEAEAQDDDDDAERQRKLAGEFTLTGLFRGVVVHKVRDLLGGGSHIRTGGHDLQFVGRDDHAGVDLVPREHVFRRFVSGQEDGVEKTAAAGDHAVDGDEFVLTDQDGLSGPDLFGMHGLEPAVPVHIDRVDVKVVQRAEQGVGVGRVERGDEACQHVQEHGGGRGRELADKHPADAGDGHEDVGVQQFQPDEFAEAVHDDLIGQDEERHHEERDGHEARALRVGVREFKEQAECQQDTSGDQLEQFEPGASEARQHAVAHRADLFRPGRRLGEFLVLLFVLFRVRRLDGFRVRVDGLLVLQKGRHRGRRCLVRVGRLVIEQRLHFILRLFGHGVRRFRGDIVDDDLLFLICQKGCSSFPHSL